MVFRPPIPLSSFVSLNVTPRNFSTGRHLLVFQFPLCPTFKRERSQVAIFVRTTDSLQATKTKVNTSRQRDTSKFPLIKNKAEKFLSLCVLMASKGARIFGSPFQTLHSRHRQADYFAKLTQVGCGPSNHLMFMSSAFSEIKQLPWLGRGGVLTAKQWHTCHLALKIST